MGDPLPLVCPGGLENNSAGLAQLYLTERLPMVRMATLLLGSSWLAEEVVQDAFVRVHDRWDEIDQPGGYLRTTVVNGCRMLLRRRGVESRHLTVERPAQPSVELPDHLVELSEALNQLDDRGRTLIVLRYFVDLPDSEIAATLGVSPITVRTIAHRALRTLRKELQ